MIRVLLFVFSLIVVILRDRENERIGPATLRDGNSPAILTSSSSRSVDDLNVRFHIPPGVFQPNSLARLGLIRFRKSLLERRFERTLDADEDRREARGAQQLEELVVLRDVQRHLGVEVHRVAVGLAPRGDGAHSLSERRGFRGGRAALGSGRGQWRARPGARAERH